MTSLTILIRCCGCDKSPISGEMAGADYGYVGAGAGKVHIYKGTDLIFKNVPEKDAVNKLLGLIESSSIPQV